MKWFRFTVLFAAAALAGPAACGQWAFDPSAHRQEPGGVGQAVGQAGRAAGPVSPFSTTWQEQAPPIAGTPAIATEWDPSGVLGRRDRDAQWRHDERMTGIDAYMQGVRDGIDAARPWHWGPPPPVPYPPVFAPARPPHK